MGVYPHTTECKACLAIGWTECKACLAIGWYGVQGLPCHRNDQIEILPFSQNDKLAEFAIRAKYFDIKQLLAEIISFF